MHALRLPEAGHAGWAVASGPMSREVAHWYLDLTDGQFQAFSHGNGQWFLYLPEHPPEQRPSRPGRVGVDSNNDSDKEINS